MGPVTWPHPLGDTRRPVRPRQNPKAGSPSALRTWWRLRGFFAPHWKSVGFAVVLLAAIAFLNLLKPWPLKWVFDRIIGQGAIEGEILTILVVVVAALLGIAVVEGLAEYLLMYCLNRTGRTVVFELRVALFDHLQRLSLQFHSRRESGDLLMRVTTDVKAVRDVLTESVAQLLNSLLFLIGMGVVLFWLDWRLALVAIGASPVIVVAMYYYVYRVKEFSRAERQSEGALASVAHEALGTVRLTRAFNQEARAQGRFTRESAASLESGFAAGLREQRAAWVIDVLTAVATAGVVWFGVHQVQSGAITSGTLIVFVSYTSSFYRPVRAVMKQSHKIVKATAQLERVVELLDIDEFVTDHPEATRAPAFAGEIELRQVSFSYEPGRPVLHDLDLRFPARRLTAVVGPTGSGKTTLLSLIPRLYDPTAGAVLIDGHDIRRYTLQSLRSQISVVLQETVLLRASIAENIAYGMPSAGQEQIEQAARAANAHDFILEQPHGYQTEVGERGDTLSGGQRQRIAIARAILRNTPILLFDEPLTGLDAGSASLVMDALEGLIRGRTAIVVTHQGVLAERADHVVVVQSGRVVKEEEREVPRAQERGRLVMPVSGHLVDRGRHR